MKRAFTPIIGGLLLIALVIPLRRGAAQSGALIPSSVGERPDASILSLQAMHVDVLIDNQHARVRVRQVFDNHTGQALEGKYLFALPPAATISDFAIWEGDTRLPGVMLERRRAAAAYSQIRDQAIDPGLLQQDDEHGGQSAFAVKVFPIPAYGTKRIELEYSEMLPVEGLRSGFTFPLKTSFGAAQPVGEFSLRLHVRSDYPVTPLAAAPAVAAAYPLNVITAGPHEYAAEWQARDVLLQHDFSFAYQIDVAGSALSWIAYRAPEQISAYDLRDPSRAAHNPDGYFEARAIFNEQRREGNNSNNSNGSNGAIPLSQLESVANEKSSRRNVILLLDTSLSMYGEKLVRAVEAVDYFLHELNAEDSFNLLLFNEETAELSPSPLAATPENVGRALAFVKGSMLGGGTDVRRALRRALELAPAFPPGERSLVLISDANPTLGTTSLKQITELFEQRKPTAANAAPPSAPVRVFAFAPGSDAGTTLLEELAAKTHGHMTRVRETEDIATQLQLFFDRINRPNIENLTFSASDDANFYQIYQTGADYSADGASHAFVGRYRRTAARADVYVRGLYGANTIDLARTVSLPEFDDTHAHLPRLWARARIDALLREMNLNGEREDYISEIIRLSQRYKLVTPYTAFLAAPRSLLRPRLIQPGDPVIRVKTDPSITSVFAVLPFGETLPLKYLPEERVWETRFLAPAWMPDGTYRCRLLLGDQRGNAYQESKSFVVDSHAPRLTISVAPWAVRAGDEVLVIVAADSDTARLVAKLHGARPVQLYWSDSDRMSVGRLRVPAGLPAGRYVLTVSAEDFAHNQSSAETRLEVR